MIFEVKNNFLKSLTEKFPYIRYNDTQFYLIEEAYYSKGGKKEIPWKAPEQSTVHRLTAELPLDREKINFEKDLTSFVNFCNYFLDNTKTKTYTKLTHTLLRGLKNDLKYTVISNWSVLEDLFEELDLKEYFYLNRFLIRVPCGSLDLNIIKIENIEKLFLEIVDLDSNQDSQKLKKDLNLTEMLDKSWTDIALSI